MKPPFFLLLLGAFPLFLSAQTAAPGADHAISFSVAPGTAFWVGPSLLEGERILHPGYRVQASYHHRLSSRLWLRAGLGFEQFLLDQTSTTVYQWPSQNNNGQFDPNLPGEVGYDLATTSQYLLVPLALRYTFGPQWYAEAEAGARMALPNQKGSKLQGGFGLSFGWQFPLSPATWIYAQPGAHLMTDFGQPKVRTVTQRDFLTLGMEVGVRVGL